MEQTPQNPQTTDMRQLVKQLNQWAKEYYTLDTPTVTDEAYDAAYDRLKLLEEQTGVILPDSPTHRVGGAVLDKFATHKHLTRLYSLDKAQSFGELKSWYDKVKTAEPNAEFTIEYKYDGLTVNLTYDGGELNMASTRGNGIEGEDITLQAKTIHSVPLTIDFKDKIEIQGECIMRLSELTQYNKKHPQDPLKNARNAAAGALRNLNTSVTAERNLNVVCYSLGFNESSVATSQTQLVTFLQSNGFDTNGYFFKTDNYEGIKAAIMQIEQQRPTLNFLIDGAVVKVNDFALRKKMGYTDKFPRWAIAFKFKAEQVSTLLKSVEWQVGRTGKLTPLGHLQPIELCGATIKKATLNNYDDILRKNLSTNSLVFVRRSNDVIPEVLGLAQANPDSTAIEPPVCCPVCGTALTKKGANLFCPNTYGCQKQIEARITHFCSKNGFDIDGVSLKTVKQLMTLGVKTPIDMFYLTKEQLLTLEGFKDKKAQNFLDAIQKSKNVTLSNFIFALGIENVGSVTAKEFASTFKSIQGLKKAQPQQLTDIEDVGEVVAQSVIDFFAGEYATKLLDGFSILGINPEYKASNSSSGIFKGKTVVLTGTLSNMTRTQAAKIIVDNGGQAQDAVTKQTNLLICGQSAGSKLDKAKALNVEIWDEAAFSTFLKGQKLIDT